MGEGNHTTNAGRKPRLAFIVAGTAVAILAGGIILQVYRADTATSAERPTPDTRQPGRASTAQPASGPASARISDGEKVYMISQDDLAKECIQRVGKEVLDAMVNRAIIQLACERQGVVVTQAEVNQEIAKIASSFNIPVDTWLQMLQVERNLTPNQYRRDVIWPMLALQKLAGEAIEISEEDIQKAFIRYHGPRVKARMIVCDNLRRAQDVWKEASRNPDDFERLARKHSIDPNSAALGGSIPPIPRFSGNEELEEAAFKLREGEVSGIVQISTVPVRYAILKCEGYTEQVITDISAVRESLEKELHKERAQLVAARVFEKIKKETRVDNYLTNTSTGGVRQTSGTAGDAVRPAARRR